ncbi:MAG: hypothetical protein WA324_14730 [Bryobacteraceae bacterium]
MAEDVQIIGGGVAACCCASLLSQAGYRVFAHVAERPGSPVLLLSGQTQLLLRDVFGCEAIFETAAQITKRIVSWGPNGEAVTLPHSGVVMAENMLLGRLWPQLNLETAGHPAKNCWRVISSKSLLPLVSEHKFGARIASTNTVTLRDTATSEACWVESTASGWLFLLPCGEQRGSLISVGATAGTLLGESRYVGDQLAGLDPLAGSFPAYPRIVTPLCGPSWIGCGSAAVAFDPIAGEGAGNAVREGILASAAIRAALSGERQDDLLAHYSNRLLSGFLRHMQNCSQYYRAMSGPWWQTESEQMERGISWARHELASSSPSRFRLNGFELERLA